MLMQGTPVFNAPTLSAKGLLQFAQGVLVLRKAYRNMLSPPMFDSPRAIRCVICGTAAQPAHHLADAFGHVLSMLRCSHDPSGACCQGAVYHAYGQLACKHCLPARAHAERMP
jgi:hypothetical protein